MTKSKHKDIMNEEKTNYRNVYKSDHLGSLDLEEMTDKGQKLVFTVKEVRQHRIDNKTAVAVAGKVIDANICYFVEPIKPLVLNSTNGKTMQFLTGSIYVEDWAGMKIELYVDKNVKMKGETVGGIRIKPIKIELKPISEVRFKAALEQIKQGAYTVEKLKSSFELTQEQLSCLK